MMDLPFQLIYLEQGLIFMVVELINALLKLA